MMNIEKQKIIDSNKLSREFYFTSLLNEAYTNGLLNEGHIENIQLQCIKLLASKSERYNDGKSSSIRIEAAECIMKSNLYTIGLFLKSLPNIDYAISELKTLMISEMYEKGRKLINVKLNAARHLYRLVQENRLNTLNYTYNATISNSGIGSFFELYNPDYEAQETPASIDYQLCNPVTDLAGVEYILKYLENLYIENLFCRNFDGKDIHHLLSGYDEGYKDLLINIFEHVLTASLEPLLVNKNALKLGVSAEEIQHLYNELSKDDDHKLEQRISSAAERVLKVLDVTNLSLREYVVKSLPKISVNIIHAVRANTLSKVFISPINPDLKPKIQFLSGAKMDDKDYRGFIDELISCRYSSDRLALIKEKAKSFGDIEDVLLDVQLSEEEITEVLGTLGDVELAALVKRYPFKSAVQAVVLSETEQTLGSYLKSYINKLSLGRQNEIYEIINQLVED